MMVLEILVKMERKPNFPKPLYEDEFPKLSKVRSKDNDLEEINRTSSLSYSARLKYSNGEQETTTFNLRENNSFHKVDQSFLTGVNESESKCPSSMCKSKKYCNNSSETFNDSRRLKLFPKHFSDCNNATGQNINEDLYPKHYNVCDNKPLASIQQKIDDDLSEQGWTLVRSKSTLEQSNKKKSKQTSHFASTKLHFSDLKTNKDREKVNVLYQAQNKSMKSNYVCSRDKITKSDETVSLKAQNYKHQINESKERNENFNLTQNSNVLTETRTENQNYKERNHRKPMNKSNPGNNDKITSKAYCSENKILKNQEEIKLFNTKQVQTSSKTNKPEKVIKQKKVNNSNKLDNIQNPPISKQSEESYNVLEFNPSTGSKKRRKSKMKRQAAFQSDKLKIISSDIHMKILKLNNKEDVTKRQKPVIIDINDSNEYPELGACFSSKSKVEAIPKNETLQEISDTSSKELPNVKKNDNSTDIVLGTEVPTVNKDNLQIKDKDVPSAAKVIEQEKSPVHFNDPITISLFDILLANKSKKKEQEKAIEVASVKVSSKSNNKKQISAVNPLDSSKPAVKRGKERENPKPKKPSQLKKIILQDRKQKKERIRSLTNSEQKMTTDKDVQTNLSSTDATSNESLNEFYVQSVADNLAFESSTLDDQEENERILSKYSSSWNNLDDKQPEESIIGNETNVVETKKFKSVECNTEKISNLDTYKKVEFKQMSNERESFSSISEVKQSFGSDNFDYTSDSQSTDCDTFISESPVKQSVINNCDSNKNIPISHKQELLSGSTLDNIFSSSKSTDIVIDFHNLDAFNNNGASSTEAVPGIGINEAQNVKEININIDDKIIQDVISSKNQNFEFLKNCSPEEAVKAAVFALHSKKFREYCTHFLHKDLEESVVALLSDLARFQDRMHQKDPVKARMKRRLLYGIREIKRHMKLKKLKCIIITTDIEDSRTEGGLNDMVNDLKSLARDNYVPCIFSLLRKKLGQVCHKPSPVSAVGILNYEGSEANFKKMVELQNDCKDDYFMVLKSFSSKLTDEEIQLLFKTKTEEISNLHNITTSLFKKYFTETIKKETSSSDNVVDISSFSLIKDDSKQDLLALKKDVHGILTKYKIVNF